MAQCRTCHAEIVWAVTSKGKMNPIDAAPVAGGNLVLVAADQAGDPPRMLTYDPAQHAGWERYVSHFATCQHAADHRVVWRGKR